MPASTSGNMIVQIELEYTAVFCVELALDHRSRRVEAALALAGRDEPPEVGPLVDRAAQVDRPRRSRSARRSPRRRAR